MIITKLEVTNWCQHQHLEIDFSPKSNGILGKNGAGKTNLTKAIRVAITGRTDSGSSLEDEITDGATSTNIKLHFLHNEVPGVISRSLYRSGSNRASVVYGDLEVSGITDTNKQINLLLGSSNDMIEKFSFVGQDSLRAILFDTPSKRLEQLISMIPEIAMTKLYRGRVDAFLKTIPEISLPYDEDYVTLKLNDSIALGASLSESFADVALKESTLGSCDAEAQLLKEHSMFLEAEASRAGRDSAYSKTTSELNATKEAIRAAGEIVFNIPDGFSAVDAAASVGSFSRFDFEAFNRFTLSKSEASVALPALLVEIESKASEVSDLEARSLSLAQETGVADGALVAMTASFERWSGIKSENSLCPICGTELQEAEMEKAKLSDEAELTSAHEQVDRLVEAARTHQAQRLISKAWLSTHKSQAEALKSNIASADAFLSSSGQPPIISNEQCTELKALLDLSTQRADHEALVNANRLEVDRLQRSLDMLAEALVNTFREATQDEVTQANAAIAMKASLSSQRDLVLIKMQSVSEDIEKFKSMLEAVEISKAERRAVDLYRSQVTTVKDMLHRDKIPKMVLSHYLGSLRDSVGSYLTAFGATFSVHIGDDFDMSFTKDGGSSRQLERMSGGEKTVLSISLHLAVSELFGSGLGLLVLDEPTSNMDVDYLSQFTQIVETLSSGILGGDRQLVVVTHQISSMAGVFDKIINV